MELTQELVKELFEYNDNGYLVYKKTRGSKPAFTMAGGLGKGNLYKRVTVMYKTYLQHQIIFFMHYGYLPKIIDHIDGNKLNNKIENLRQCTTNQNAYNSKKPITNTSGFKGVSWHKNRKTWQASIRVNAKLKYLGSFDTPELAHEAYKKSALDLHGEFARFQYFWLTCKNVSKMKGSAFKLWENSSGNADFLADCFGRSHLHQLQKVGLHGLASLYHSYGRAGYCCQSLRGSASEAVRAGVRARLFRRAAASAFGFC